MKILHLDTNHPLLIEQLRSDGHENIEKYSITYDALLSEISEYEGVVLRSRIPLNQKMLEKAVRLKFIGRVGAGLENIDVDFARQKNIQIFNAPEGNRNAVGEHALGMLLALFNKLHTADREVRSGVWKREENRGLEVDGKTVSLIGYGNTGKAFARKLRGFNVEVLCYDILDDIENSDAHQVAMEEIFEKTDILSLHIPQTPDTLQLVDSEYIQKFKKPFWLINTARGKSVVTEALVSALEDKQILGAALDVLEYEKTSFENLFTQQEMPDAFRKLLAMKNVLLTPHVAGWTVESKEKLAQTIVDKIRANFM